MVLSGTQHTAWQAANTEATRTAFEHAGCLSHFKMHNSEYEKHQHTMVISLL